MLLGERENVHALERICRAASAQASVVLRRIDAVKRARHAQAITHFQCLDARFCKLTAEFDRVVDEVRGSKERSIEAVFTDIEGSMGLWERQPHAIRKKAGDMSPASSALICHATRS